MLAYQTAIEMDINISFLRIELTARRFTRVRAYDQFRKATGSALDRVLMNPLSRPPISFGQLPFFVYENSNAPFIELQKEMKIMANSIFEVN